MSRAEKTGLGVAFSGHVLLFGLLSVGFLATPNPMKLRNDPVEVQFVDEIGLKSAFPKPAIEEPAPSIAPEIGMAQDSPPPAPTAAEPAPPAPAPRAAPQPAPVKPTPQKPTPARQASAPPSRNPARDVGSARAETPQPRRGSLLGDDFRKGLAATARRQATGDTPRAAVVGPQALASLGAAIARQIRPCYDLGPLGGTAAMDIVVKVRLQPTREGVVTRQRLEIAGFSGVDGSNSMYQARMAEVARNAVLNPRCSPLELPAELYEGGWQDITLNFIPRQLG
ncbi:hypothetical protein [Sphingomonas flavalba]|uniref:hypothetical protein n=1 Tax=Sphingomonas flavalba TaxID=2559804 RepID=UPI00109E21E7|nr:hypothetical protein [Sphingomonas flavalba]